MPCLAQNTNEIAEGRNKYREISQEKNSKSMNKRNPVIIRLNKLNNNNYYKQQDGEFGINNVKPNICLNSPPARKLAYSKTKSRLINPKPKSQLKYDSSAQTNAIHKKSEFLR